MIFTISLLFLLSFLFFFFTFLLKMSLTLPTKITNFKSNKKTSEIVTDFSHLKMHEEHETNNCRCPCSTKYNISPVLFKRSGPDIINRYK